MHILVIADGRSPTTKRWIQGLAALEYRVTLVSTFPCGEVAGAEAIYVLPVAFGALAGGQAGNGAREAQPGGGKRLLRRMRSALVGGRYWLGPLTLAGYGRKLRRLVATLKPDLVHALRIPFEGMLAAQLPPGLPVVMSIWGNDLTLHANRNGSMARLTRAALLRANALLADTRRDIRLAREWGLAAEKPVAVVPGSGGIDVEEVRRAQFERDGSPETFPAGVPLVINPRGFRPGSVLNETFFQAAPLVLQKRPGTVFLCPGMAGQAEALRWMERLKLSQQMRLLPLLAQPQLWDLFYRADVTVSVSQHDGTPNSLLEAMVCGCFPVVGDIESLREWITPGVNGLLVDPNSPQALAEAILLALESSELRKSAAEINLKLVCERAEVGLVRAELDGFYRALAADPRE